MRARIAPFAARGALEAQTSKSCAHRLLLCAALADGESFVEMESRNDDVDATLSCLSALTGVRMEDDGAYITPAERHPMDDGPLPLLDCGESGSTLRFLLPMASLLGGARLTGRGRLPARPLADLMDAMRLSGAVFSAPALPFTVDGGYRGGSFHMPGNVSSQYLTGLLLAAPAAPEDTEITLTTPLESAAYVDMTLQAMETFGVRAERTPSGFAAKGGGRYHSPGRVRAEGDWSSAAFPLCLGALGGPVTVTGLAPDSLQGDRAVTKVLKEIGAHVTWSGDSVTVSRGELRAADVDMRAIPDMAPALAAVLMHARGESRLYNAGRLRLKESDRLESVRAMVTALGGDAAVEGDALRIRGRASIPGGDADGAGDHRIVMAACVAASLCTGESRVSCPEALRKSYPAFPEHLRRLGGIFDVVDDG